MVDVLNVRSGFLSRSSHPADADALSRFCLLESFSEDAASRCAQAAKPSLGAGGSEQAVDCMRIALHQSLGGTLAQLCADAHSRFANGGRPSGSAGESGDRGPRARSTSLGAGASALGEWNALLGEAVSEVSASGGGASGACCGALSHVYASQPFREWWGEPGRTRAPERLQWLDYRSKGVDLLGAAPPPSPSTGPLPSPSTGPLYGTPSLTLHWPSIFTLHGTASFSRRWTPRAQHDPTLMPTGQSTCAKITGR